MRIEKRLRAISRKHEHVEEVKHPEIGVSGAFKIYTPTNVEVGDPLVAYMAPYFTGEVLPYIDPEPQQIIGFATEPAKAGEIVTIHIPIGDGRVL